MTQATLFRVLNGLNFSLFQMRNNLENAELDLKKAIEMKDSDLVIYWVGSVNYWTREVELAEQTIGEVRAELDVK